MLLICQLAIASSTHAPLPWKIERMDVTSLLNTVRRPSYCGGGIEDSPNHPNHGKTISPPNVLPIPWVEDSKQSSDINNRRNSKLWNASGVSVTQIDESDSLSRAGPPVSPKHVERAIPEANNRPRRPSTEFTFSVTSQLPILLARHIISR